MSPTQDCEVGYAGFDGVCERCDVGSERNAERTVCLQCSAGRVSLDGTQCVACTAGNQPNVARSACVPCPYPQYFDGAVCVACPAGQKLCSGSGCNSDCVPCGAGEAGANGLCWKLGEGGIHTVVCPYTKFIRFATHTNN